MYDAYDSVNGTLEEMTWKWADFCEKMGNKVKANNEVYLEVKTYNPDKQLYSYDHYEKQIQMLPPRLVGIVQNASDVQAYADSLILNNTVIQIPNTSGVCSTFTMTYEEAPLVFVGTPNPNGLFMGLDGNYYDITTTAYRIDGANGTAGNYTASIHEITIDEYYIFRTNFTGYGIDPKYYQRLLGAYNEYYIYTPPI